MSATRKYSPVTHVIFDLDGTLINSEKYLHQAVNDILRSFGKTFDQELRNKTVGLFMTKSSPMIIEHCNLPITTEEYNELFLTRFKQYLNGEVDGEGIRLLPGVQRLVSHFAAHNVPMAICTGSMKKTYDYKVQHFGDFFEPGNYFHHVVLGAADPEVKENKPNPEPYLVCMKRFPLPENTPPLEPNKVLAFEDSPTGLISAITAGCQCVLIPDPKIDLTKLPADPTLTLSSMEQFKPEEFGLPPFDDDC